MTKKITDKDFSKFISILEKSNFKKEEFLFHSKPYLNGFKMIINKTVELIKKQKFKILDFGCGTGLTSYLLASLNNKVEAIDIYDKDQEIQNAFVVKGKNAQKTLWNNLKKSNRNLKFQFYDGENLSFKNSWFDMVFCHAVLEHIPSNILHKVLQEIYRVLKNNGYFIISRTPNKYALTEFLTKGHNVKFSKSELFGLLNQNRYKTIHYQKTDFFPEITPAKFQNLLNKSYPVTSIIDRLISLSPLEIFSHHHFIILQKILIKD